MENRVRVVIYEDDDLLRENLSSLMMQEESIDFCGALPNADTVLNDIEDWKPEVILMDIDMPGTNGMQALKLIRSKFHQVEVLMLTVFDDNEKIFECIKLGASGYLLKRTTPEKIIEAIHEAEAGGAPMTASVAKKVLSYLPHTNYESEEEKIRLTPRETEVLQLLVQGYSFKMIASQLNNKTETVRTLIKRIYDKLQVHSATEAVSRALRDRLV